MIKRKNCKKRNVDVRKNRTIKIIFVILLSLFISPISIYGDENDVENAFLTEKPLTALTKNEGENKHGMFGTSEWYLTEDGELHFGDGSFAVRPSYSTAGTPWDPEFYVKKIVFDGKVKANRDSSGLFSQFKYLTEIENLDFLDVSETVNMKEMFKNSNELVKADVSNWNTSNVEDMSSMFSQTLKLEEIDVSKWDTSRVKSMFSLFYGASNLRVLDVSNWNTHNVEDMSVLFSDTYVLENLDVSKWDTSKVTNMSYMFAHNFSNASDTVSIDLSKWNTSNVEDMFAMFYGRKNIDSLDLSRWDTRKVANMGYMFKNTTLKNINVSGWNTANVNNMSYMFGQSEELEQLDVSSWNTRNVSTMGFMFSGTKSLNTLDVSNWDTHNVTDLTMIFSETINLKTIDVSNWDTGNVIYLYGAFESSGVEALDLSRWNIQNVSSMQSLFSGADKLQVLDISGWNFSDEKAIKMDYIFSNTTSLSSLKLGKGILMSALSNSKLPEITEDDTFTGKWINIGTGTLERPDGENVWTSTNLVNSYDGTVHADTYVWQKKPVYGHVIIKYQDDEGNQITDSVVISGEVGLPFETQKVDFEGLTLTEKPHNATGVFTKESQEVVYIYTKKGDSVNPEDPKPIEPDKPDISTPSTDDDVTPNQLDENVDSTENEGDLLPQTGVGDSYAEYLIIIGVCLVFVSRREKTNS